MARGGGAHPAPQAAGRRLAGATGLRHPLAAAAVRRRVCRGRLAGRGGWPRGQPDRAADLRRGAGAGRGALRRGQLRGAPACRAHHRRGRVGRATGPVPAAHPAGRGGVVPGVQRARRRQRSGVAAHPRRPRRRSLRGERHQDLDQPCRGGRLLRTAGAHRDRGLPAQGHHLVGHVDGHARHRCPTVADHRRVDRVRRVVPRRRAGPGGQPGGPGERRLAGDDGDVRLRARHRLRG